MHTIMLVALLSLHSADVSTACRAFSVGLTATNRPSSCAAVAGLGIAVDSSLIALVETKVHTPWKRYLIYGLAASAHGLAAIHNQRVITSYAQ